MKTTKKKCLHCKKFISYELKINKYEHYRYFLLGKLVMAGEQCMKCIYKKRAKLNTKNNYATYKKYEKTKQGFLVRAYRNMKSRVLGIQKIKSHLYLGKDLLNKEIFYNWALNNTTFYDLFSKWKKSGYKRRLTPSVDRINSSLGYVLENMEWVPFHVNCSRGGKSKGNKTRAISIEPTETRSS